jgi:hypothetical protein
MPHLPESARLWLERAEIDYIGPFVKAWAAFNSWYREASGASRDAEGLRYVKERPNPIRGSISPSYSLPEPTHVETLFPTTSGLISSSY